MAGCGWVWLGLRLQCQSAVQKWPLGHSGRDRTQYPKSDASLINPDHQQEDAITRPNHCIIVISRAESNGSMKLEHFLRAGPWLSYFILAADA